MPTALSNWSGHTPFHAARFHRPTNLDQIHDIVRRADRMHVVGTGHSFPGIADTEGDLISLSHFDKSVQIDSQKRTVTVGGGITYRELCPQLQQAGYALHNLASLDHISVVGACTTATHGSGDRLGNLATAVSGIEIVRADHALVTLSRERDGDLFLGTIVSFGTLGIVTKVTLDLQPTFDIQQEVYQGLSEEQLYQNFDAIMSHAYSVSLFTNWQKEGMDTIWVKHRMEPGSTQPPAVPKEIFGATLASPDRKEDPASDRYLTPLGLPGPWHERLPHFVFKDALREGNELQSEYFVPRRNAVAALQSVARLRQQLIPLLGVTEVRSMTADPLWLSMAYGEDTVGIHFNWLKNWAAIKPFLPVLEAALAPFQPRPHWGKLFAMPSSQFQPLYPRMADFRDLQQKWDPKGKFRNDFVDRCLWR